MGYFKRFLERGWLTLILVSPCIEAQHLGSPVLTAQLHVVDGYARVDRSATSSRLELGPFTPEFDRCGLRRAEVQEQLFDILDGVMAAGGPLVEAIPTVAAGKKKDGILNSIRASKTSDAISRLYHANRNWADFNSDYSDWLYAFNQTRPSVPLPESGSAEWYRDILSSTDLGDTPMTPLHPPGDEDSTELAQDFDAGVMTLSIAPLGSSSSLRIVSTAQTSNWDEMKPALQQVLEKRFSCTLWQRDQISQVIRRALEVRGYKVTKLSPLQAGAVGAVVDTASEPGSVQFFVAKPEYGIPESGGIRVSPITPLSQLQIKLDPEIRGDDVRHVLHLLLSDEDKRHHDEKLAGLLCRKPATVTSSGEVQLLKKPKGAAPLSLFQRPMTPALTDRYRQLMRSLQLDFVVISSELASISTTDDKQEAQRGDFVDLPLCDREQEPGKPDLPKPSLPPPPVARDVKEAKKTENFRNSINLRIDKDPSDSVKPTITLTHAPAGDDNIWSMEIGQQDRTSGKLEYARDFLGFDTLGKRLRLSAAVFSNHVKNRPVVANGSADEKRSGGQIRTTLDLWNDAAGGSFGQAQLGLTRSNVQYPGTSVAGENLSVIDLGLTIAGGKPDAWREQRFEVSTNVSLGKPSGTEGNYGKVELEGLFRQMLGVDTRIFLHGKAAAISSNAPQSEWPTFGGSDSVRGYRAQAAAARQVWSVQNEYWLPLAGLLRKESDFASNVRRSTALALFVDAGGLSQDTPSPGARWGAGIGLRIALPSNVILQLDWARPLGRELATSPRENRFYLTFLAYRLP